MNCNLNLIFTRGGSAVDKTGAAAYNITLFWAGVAELADASDSKSDEEYLRKGSIPFSGIFTFPQRA